jgi:hypothetical protein
MVGFIKRLFIPQDSYPQVFRAGWSVPMLDSDALVVQKYATILTDTKDLTKEMLMKLLDDYNDALCDLTFKVKDVIAVDPVMAIRWYTLLDGVQTANQLLFSRLSKERRREISSLLIENLTPMH